MISPQPRDPSRNHFYISLVKSVFRICAGIALVSSHVVTAGILLILAEVLGILEEIL